mmetsp:Transcript_144978/g.463299  ORF Transcript_144978/g.463299 Transcript_144978/m.463299 type:complete len:223 (-) Transcript_144978:322-990(-)
MQLWACCGAAASSGVASVQLKLLNQARQRDRKAHCRRALSASTRTEMECPTTTTFVLESTRREPPLARGLWSPGSRTWRRISTETDARTASKISTWTTMASWTCLTSAPTRLSGSASSRTLLQTWTLTVVPTAWRMEMIVSSRISSKLSISSGSCSQGGSTHSRVLGSRSFLALASHGCYNRYRLPFRPCSSRCRQPPRAPCGSAQSTLWQQVADRGPCCAM